MFSGSRGRCSAGRASRVSRLGGLAAAWLLAGCAELLGIPDDPLLVPAQPSLVEPVDASAGSGGGAQLAPPSNVPSEDAGRGADGLGADGVLPPGSVVGIDGALAPDASTNAPDTAEPEPGAEPSLDAGAELDAAVGVDAEDCSGLLGRVPVDVIVVFDNSGSMAAEAEAFEQALPAFAERLDADGVDHRIILISRHREAARESSDDASTSVCIQTPLGGGGCPSESPAPGPRFFHYSIEIDASDSFARIFESFTEPDPFGLTDSGWSAWLRADARKVFIEITDGNSNASVDAFLNALAGRDQGGELFSGDGRPSFVFHSITGLVSKRIALAVYDASEPIESLTCSGDGGNPGNAGEIYQALSRRTGGLRMPVCPPSLLGSRLQVLATDVALRSLRVCPLDD